MGYRIHTADIGDVVISHTNPATYFEDDEMPVEPALILDNGGNLEALVIVGSISELTAFAHTILDRLPLELTESEQKYLDHVCEQNEYDADNGSVGRTFAGWAYFTSDEDDTTFDLTNEQERAVEYDES
jgi:hypothetical protein